MPSQYLQAADYANYGLPATTTAAQITQASLLIDAYLNRPMGLQWTADSNGNPAFMTSATPALTLTLVNAISPGVQVVAQVAGPYQELQVGDVIVLDRTNPALCEAVQIVAITTDSSGNPYLTFGSNAGNVVQGVQFAHAAGATVDFGCVITESRLLPSGRSQVILAYTPTIRVIGGTGRYGYGRRGSDGSSNMDDFNLLAAINKFGGPPAWELWPANTAAGINVQTGEVWVPAGVMLAYYSEVKIRYVAGYSYANLPPVIKQACATLVSNIAASGNTTMFKSYRAGDTQIQRFAMSNIDDDTKRQLDPYKVRFFA